MGSRGRVDKTPGDGVSMRSCGHLLEALAGVQGSAEWFGLGEEGPQFHMAPSCGHVKDEGCRGLNCVHPERQVHVLTPSTCECGVIWKQGLCRWNEVEDFQKRSFCFRMALNPMIRVRHRRAGTQIQRRSHMKMEAEMETRGHQPRSAWSPRSWKRQEGPSLQT